MASLWQKINPLYWFGPQPNPEESSVSHAHASGADSEMDAPSHAPFEWIENEDLLREEGAVYGLAGKGLEDKQQVIQNYYQRFIAAQEIELARINDRINTSRGWQEDIADELNAIQQEYEELVIAHQGSQHKFYRLMLGLVVYGIILAFTFWGVYQWVAPVWIDFPLLITIGIFLFGSLSLLGNWSMVYHGDEQVAKGLTRERWKTYIEEYAIPLITAVFVAVAGAKTQHIGINLSFSLVVFLVFVFTGKGLFMTVLGLGEQNKIRMINWRKAKRRKARLQELKVLRQEKEQLKKDVTQQLETLRIELTACQQRISDIQHICNAKVAYFTSEYELAKAASIDAAWKHYYFQSPSSRLFYPPQTNAS